MSPRLITTLSGIALIMSGILVAVLGLPHVISAGLLAIGLLGLHYRQAAAAGLLSLTGSGIVFLGFILLVNRPMLESLLGEASGPSQNLGMILLPVIILTNGVVVFGISMIRGRIFPWRNGVFLILSVLLVLVLGSLGAVLFGTSLSWLGYIQLTGKDVTGESLDFDE